MGLTLDNTGGTGGGQIVVSSGDVIAAPLTLANGGATVSLNAAGNLNISGNIADSPAGQSLTVSGDGTGTLYPGRGKHL